MTPRGIDDAVGSAGDDLGAARRIAREFAGIDEGELETWAWTGDRWRRRIAVLVLEGRYRRGDAAQRVEEYERFTAWLGAELLEGADLVDGCAEHVVGEQHVGRSPGPLFALAKSDVVWARRAAALAGLALVKHGESDTPLALVERLARERSPIIQEALVRLLHETARRAPEPTAALLARVGARWPAAVREAAVENLPAHLRPAT